MNMGTIQKIIMMFQEAFEKLQVRVSLRKIEDLAILVHKAMTVHGRKYHTAEHIFSFAELTDPFQSLAALFHDLICYQVDRGFAPEIERMIAPYLQEKEGKLFLTEERCPNDRPFTLTCNVFGFQTGQQLPLFAGLSEFLSALVMSKELTGILLEKDILSIAVCIEATIPFRGKNDRGESYPEMLEQRLTMIQQRDKLFMNFGEIEEIIKRAVVFANKDVENFVDPDPSKFLDNTWKLLPETNVSLRAREIYSIKDYRQALQKMEGFFGGLNIDNIFHRYRGVPAEPEFQHMVTSAHRNVAIAREYLGIKLLTMIILEAFANLTGGDVPLSLIMGDLRKEGENTQSLEDFLPIIEEYRFIDHSSPVFQLLETGRASESSFDIKNSPLSAFLYKQMGPVKLKHLLASAKDVIAGTLSARDFLKRIDRSIISAIAGAMAAMVITRREQLLQYSLPELAQDMESSIS